MERSKIILPLFALLCCALSLNAAQPPAFAPKYSWELAISAQDGPLPAQSVVFVRYWTEGGRELGTLLSLREDGRATLYTSEGVSSAEISFDDQATPALDALWSGSLEAASIPIMIRLQPIGEVAGVLLAQNASPVAYSEVELSCSDGSKRNATTSASGSFSFSRVRAGSCLASANVEGQAVRQEFSLGMGEFRSIEMKAETPDLLSYAATGLAVLAAVAVFWSIARKGQKPQEPPEEGQESPQRRAKPAKAEKMPTQRQRDLLATLDSKEKSIVQFVLHHFPSAVRVSRIRRDLLIPKTSLTRTVAALERKQFLKIEKIGSRQFAVLHEFFRGEGAT